MRIRIVEPRNTRVDGIDLSVFAAGRVYEVDPSIATYLIVSGVAQPCAEASPALVVHSNEVMVGVFAGGRRTLSDVADDFEDDVQDGSNVSGFQGAKVLSARFPKF